MSVNNKRASAILGSPFPKSTSEKIVELVFERLRENSWETDVIDLSKIDAESLLIRNEDEKLDKVLKSVVQSDLIITASPTYRATYTGLLKVFLDLLPQESLSEKLVLPIQTGGSSDHSLTIEHGITPVMRSLGATVLTNTIYAWSSQFKEDGSPSPGIIELINNSVKELDFLLN